MNQRNIRFLREDYIGFILYLCTARTRQASQRCSNEFANEGNGKCTFTLPNAASIIQMCGSFFYKAAITKV